MPESEPRKPYPIPVEDDYSAAAELTDDLFQENGGAWTFYHKVSLVDVETNPTIRNLFQVMSRQARLVEPIQDESLRPIDPMFRATHAFRAGLWSGGHIAHFLHQDLIGYEAIHNSINNSIPYANYDGHEQYEENGCFLVGIGDEGLEISGYDTRKWIDAWGSDIVSEPSVRKYYALGAGAVIFASHKLYSQIHDTAMVNYQAAQLTEELSTYLSEIRGSSDN